eukprot:TRINITY_DN662_c0_g1_i1.p1 TRINITY_DN662_c0_g1~~TRINITY_DN662_c0_g1_i1.p1  ORF type:complete len:454 (+),score=72.75 TRINITY_DN662_c0_g1_i1:201-1562(+)
MTELKPVGKFHPSQPAFRWIFLVFICFLTFGSYWCYDIPGALQDSLTARLHITNADQWKFNLIYSIYNFINIVIVLFGGVFVDRIGLRIGSCLFCLLIAIGQIVFSIGVSLPDYNTAYLVLMIGRAIFSLGGESLSVAQSTYCSKWFLGKELALSFGITLSFARIGSFANFNVSPPLAAKFGVPFAVWFGTATCIISLIFTFFAAGADKARDSYVKTEKISAATPFHIRDIKYFPASLWLLYLICVFFYCTIFTLISLSGQPYLLARFPGFDQTSSSRILSIPYIMAAALAPFCGWGVDRVGRKPLWMLLCSLLVFASYFVLILGPFSKWVQLGPIISMFILGVSYSLCAASLWPCVPLLVDENKVGTAYGIMNAIQNGGLAACAAIVGVIVSKCSADDPNRDCTIYPLYFLALVGILTTICCILLILVDLSSGRILTRSSSQKDETQPLLTN